MTHGYIKKIFRHIVVPNSRTTLSCLWEKIGFRCQANRVVFWPWPDSERSWNIQRESKGIAWGFLNTCSEELDSSFCKSV